MTQLPALPAAAAYIALLTIALVPLTLSVMRLRMMTGTGIGNGGHGRLEQAIRVHANYAENIPFGLALLLLLALIGSPVWAVHVLGLGLIMGRASHALGLSRFSGPSPGPRRRHHAHAVFPSVWRRDGFVADAPLNRAKISRCS